MVTGWVQPWWIARPTKRQLSRLCDRLVGGSCSVVSARIGATLPQRQAARIVIRHPFNPTPHPQHHRRLALSNGLAHDQNPAAAVGTGIASSASVRAEKRAVDRRIHVDDDRRRVGHVGPLQQLVALGGLLIKRYPFSLPPRFASHRPPR